LAIKIHLPRLKSLQIYKTSDLFLFNGLEKLESIEIKSFHESDYSMINDIIPNPSRILEITLSIYETCRVDIFLGLFPNLR
jgi:hypothetical protein